MEQRRFTVMHRLKRISTHAYPCQSHLEPRLRIVPVRPDYGRVFVAQCCDVYLVLLRPLVVHVVAVGPGEEDLGGVVDVAAHVELALLERMSKKWLMYTGVGQK